MFGLGTGELVVIFAIVVLIFGASRLPQLGDGVGKALRGFKRAVSEIDEDPGKKAEETAHLNAKDAAGDGGSAGVKPPPDSGST